MTTTPARYARPLSTLRSRLTRVATLVAALVAIASALFATMAPAAEAASTAGGDFSSFFNPNVNVFWVDDCRVEVGIVVDWAPAATGWHHVGGVRANCATWHSIIDATVALYYWTGTRWVQYGSSSYGARYGSAGSGSQILYTPRYCVGSLTATSWMVGATVRTERAGYTSYSYPAQSSDPRQCR
jgi:plastocyanin